MNNIRKANCYSSQQKNNTEARFLKALQLWSTKWFVSADLSLYWHWNTVLFGCASDISESSRQDNDGWIQAASHSLFGNSNKVLASPYVEKIKHAMQHELDDIYGLNEEQLAAVIEVNVDNNYTFLINLPLSYLAEDNKSINENAFISTALLEAMSEQQIVSVHSEIKSCQIPLTQLLNLKVGDQILLDHDCQTPIDITMEGEALAKGYLVNNQGQRAVVLKQA